MATQVAIEDLSDWLSEQSANTVETPYEITITGLQVNDFNNTTYENPIKTALLANNTKYVDLRTTVLPNGLKGLRRAFYQCSSLIYSPAIPNTVTTVEMCFYGASNLIEAPELPKSVTVINYAFSYCTHLKYANAIKGNTDAWSYCVFENCSSLIRPPTFEGSVATMYEWFKGCSSLETAPIFKGKGKISLYYTFSGCTSLKTVPYIPESYNMICTFADCTSLEEITLCEADIESLVNDNNAQYCFGNCTSLVKIGVVNTTPSESDDWHVFSLKFGASDVQGKVYSRDGTYVTIPQTSITKSDLQLPILTDELWFPTESDNDIDTTILKMLQYRYGVFKKETIPPDEKTMVLWADDAEHFKTNLPIQPVDEVTVGNMHSVTSNAVAKATEVILNQPLQLEAGFRCIEYVRYSKFGRLVIVDIGGLIKDTAGSGLWTTQLPIVRTRCVQQAFQDGYGANVYSACIYLAKDTTNGMGHFEGNIRYYANLVYLTD